MEAPSKQLGEGANNGAVRKTVNDFAGGTLKRKSANDEDFDAESKLDEGTRKSVDNKNGEQILPMEQEKLNLENFGKGYCLFCFVNWENTQTEVKCLLPPSLSSTCSVPLKIICSILDINLEEIFYPVLQKAKLPSVENTEVEVKLCQDCDNNSKKLKELYGESERCEKGIKECLQTLKNTPSKDLEEEMFGDLTRLLYSKAIKLLRGRIAQKCGIFEPAKPNQNVPEPAPESAKKFKKADPPRKMSKPASKKHSKRSRRSKTVKSKNKFDQCGGCGKNVFPSQLTTHLKSCRARARALFYDRVNIRKVNSGSQPSSSASSGLNPEESKPENETRPSPPSPQIL